MFPVELFVREEVAYRRDFAPMLPEDRNDELTNARPITFRSQPM